MFALNRNECSTVSSHHPQRDVSCTDTTLDSYEIMLFKFSKGKIFRMPFVYIPQLHLLYPLNQPTFLKSNLLYSMKKLSKGQSSIARRDTHSTSQLPRRAQREKVVLSQRPSTGEALD